MRTRFGAAPVPKWVNLGKTSHETYWPSKGDTYFIKALTPNPSLNRTHCGVPVFGPPFHSGPNIVTPQWSG